MNFENLQTHEKMISDQHREPPRTSCVSRLLPRHTGSFPLRLGLAPSPHTLAHATHAPHAHMHHTPTLTHSKGRCRAAGPEGEQAEGRATGSRGSAGAGRGEGKPLSSACAWCSQGPSRFLLRIGLVEWPSAFLTTLTTSGRMRGFIAGETDSPANPRGVFSVTRPPGPGGQRDGTWWPGIPMDSRQCCFQLRVAEEPGQLRALLWPRIPHSSDRAAATLPKVPECVSSRQTWFRGM